MISTDSHDFTVLPADKLPPGYSRAAAIRSVLVVLGLLAVALFVVIAAATHGVFWPLVAYVPAGAVAFCVAVMVDALRLNAARGRYVRGKRAEVLAAMDGR